MTSYIKAFNCEPLLLQGFLFYVPGCWFRGATSLGRTLVLFDWKLSFSCMVDGKRRLKQSDAWGTNNDGELIIILLSDENQQQQ